MKRLLFLGCVAAFVSPASAATPIFIVPDVPTTESGGNTLQTWEIWRYDTPPAYSLVFSVPGSPTLDAIHKLDLAGDWLLSVEAASDLAGFLPAPAEPRDVIRYDSAAGSYSVFFCGGAVGIPAGVNVDAVSMEGGDAGNLIVSFDVPVDLLPFPTFEPADLVRFAPTGGPLCSDWAIAAANPSFDASASGGGVALSTNGIGADGALGMTVFSVDVPTDLAPPAATYLPATLVQWDGLTYSAFETLAGWPAGSLVDGISCLANPGVLPISPASDQMFVSKVGGGDIVLDWSASCSSGAEDYGIYEGTIGTYYSHTMIDCDDAGSDLVEQITPAVGSNYYLVVPHGKAEGSYGRDSAGAERPFGGAVCATPQILTPCP